VVWVGNEDDPATCLRPRLDAADADVSKVHYVAGIRTGSEADDFRPLSIGPDLPRIIGALDALPDCKMIVLDPVSEFMVADENSSKEIRSELMPLVRVCNARGIALVAVCHQNKKQGMSTLQKVSGGGAWTQIARAVLIFTEDQSEGATDNLRQKRLMVVAKMSGGKKNVGQAYRLNMRDGHSVPALEWISGELAINADDVAYRPSGGQAHQERTGDAVDMLRGLLANGPMKAREVWDTMERAGHGRRQRDRAADLLSVVKQQTGLGWEWSLPLDDAASEVGTDGVHPDFKAFGLPEEGERSDAEWASPFPR
jgi:putative DNA primase/helicase